MALTKPQTYHIVQDHTTTGTISGGPGNDHLVHHRDPSVEGHAGTSLASYDGDDILEASVPDSGQVHMFAATGDDWFILDVTKIPGAAGTQGHHAYGGHGQNTFQFINIDQNHSPIVGRLDDFDPTSDHILIEGTEIDLTDLPQTVTLDDGSSVVVRVVEIEHPELIGENLGVQNFLAIGDDIFYALEGARDLQNGSSGMIGEERHFVLPEALEILREAETVQYVVPDNFVPHAFYEAREDELTLNYAPRGEEVLADIGENDAAHMFGGKGNSEAASSSGAQIMRGSPGDDVITGNTGNDSIYGGDGNDLIAGGIDNDEIQGGSGNDSIWGGDGNDSLYGGEGDDFLKGGRGDDLLIGGAGDDVLVGGRGENTLIGGGGEDAVNRFHFAAEDSHTVINDFKISSDLITLQHEIDPLTVELYENAEGDTVMNYGQNSSVELRGVSLAEFQDAAEFRAEDGNPVITITPDPQEEMLRDLRIENGFYGEADPPSLHDDTILYGDTPFWGVGAGGYTYVTSSTEDEPIIEPLPKDDEEEEDEDDDDEDMDNDKADSSCFVATAAYRDASHPDVVFLRAFRDQWLVRYRWGRVFIAVYWRIGPVMAQYVRHNDKLSRASKCTIAALVRGLRKLWTEQ